LEAKVGFGVWTDTDLIVGILEDEEVGKHEMGFGAKV
jgi:hypothetical protein